MTQRLGTNAVEYRALSKACRLLDSADLPPVQDAERKLKDLHPRGPVLITVDPLCRTGSFDFLADQVQAAFSSFPPGSGAGPSGLKPSHLKELLKSSERSRLLDALTSLSSAIASGAFLPSACPCSLRPG